MRLNEILRIAFLTPFLALFCVASSKQQPLRELTTVGEIRDLTTEQAQEARPIKLRGVVTVLSGWKSSFFFQDATRGISVDRTNNSPALKPGQLVVVHGVTGAGLFAPVVIAESVTVVGQGKMPAAPKADIAKLGGGKLDSQLVTVQGIIRSALVKRSWGRSVLFLEIDIGGGNLVTARVHDFTAGNLDMLPASEVSIRGVCGTVFNDKRQFIGLRLFVASLVDVKVQRLARSNPFEGPIRGLGSLLQFGGEQGAINRIKVRGLVTYSEPGRGVYVQADGHGVLVKPIRETPLPLGSQLEIAGYPAIGRYSPELDDAVFHIVGREKPITPIETSAAGMIVEKDDFKEAPYDSLLVQLEARLVEDIPGATEDRFLFEDKNTIFTARLLRSPQDSRDDRPTVGSLLKIIGICAAQADESHEARSFEILLRSPSDLIVLEAGPWWTASHAQWVVVLLTIVIFGMLGWLTLVRRQNQMRLLTVTDPLTGLHNRRGFLPLVQHQWQLSLRTKRPLLLFYVDVDRFKEINDSLGHKQGDIALQTVAAVLRGCFRKTDVIGRIGGDEFAIAAIEASENDRSVLEQHLAEALQTANQSVDCPFHLALSVGTLVCDTILRDLSIEELLVRADSLMYEQKRARKAREKELGSLNGIELELDGFPQR